MLSSNKIILETLAVLRQHSVVNYVLCPGSRNAGIVHSICQIEDFYTYTATDERSAGFMAIGIAQATNLPTAVVVTSGSALANLYPAACEAYYQHIPLVFISADRPAAWINQMDGQTMPQPNALGQMVKMCINLPSDNLWHANRMLNEACITCHRKGPQGPVHINIPLEEPIYEFTATTLPEVRVIRYVDFYHHSIYEQKYHYDMDLFKSNNTLIIFGQMSENKTPDPAMLQRLAGKFNIVAESLCNLPPDLYHNASDIDWAQVEGINRVITLGGHIINKELKQYLRQQTLVEHWHVSEDGAIADLFCQQTMAIRAEVDHFLEVFNSYTDICAKPISLPKRAKAEDYRLPILNRFFQSLPARSALFLANSSAVRLAQLVDKHTYVNTLCNRGINGIEGTLSAAVGYAMVWTEQQVFVVIGDLSFFYDQNALWHTTLPKNLHILLLNDGGGSIFNTLPLPKDAPQSIEAITGTHTLTAKHVAQMHGIGYMQGEENITEFINTQETSILEII